MGKKTQSYTYTANNQQMGNNIAGQTQAMPSNEPQPPPEVVLYRARGGGGYAWAIIILVTVLVLIPIFFYIAMPDPADQVCATFFVIMWIIIVLLVIVTSISNTYWITTYRIIKSGIGGRKEVPISHFVSWDSTQTEYQRWFNVVDIRFHFTDGSHMTWNNASNAGYLIGLLQADENTLQNIIESRIRQNQYNYYH